LTELGSAGGAGGRLVDRRQREIQLWTATLDLDGPGIDSSLLPEEVLDRASRLRFESDRTRFIASRVWLHIVLARGLGVSVQEITLQTAAGGKPELAPPMPTWLRFSMSRAGSRGLYALARDAEVGVDLEDRSRVVDTEAVANRFFSGTERELLGGLDETEKQLGFYRIWTRKEAVLKAMGVGLDVPMAALDVSGEMARWDPTVPRALNDGRHWFLHDLDVGPGHAAALACEANVFAGIPIPRDAAELLLGGRRESGTAAGSTGAYCW
jgi:4'-phosphopantetheinyl transferase